MSFDERHPEYVPLSAAISGHLMIAALEAVAAAVVLVLVSWLSPSLGADVTTLVLMAALACMLSGLVCALLERPAVVAAQHAGPGGWCFAIWQFIVPAVAGYVVGRMESPQWAIVCAGVVWLVNVAEAMWVQPWKKSMDRSQVRANWEELKDYANEQRLEDGWVGPAADRSKKH